MFPIRFSTHILFTYETRTYCIQWTLHLWPMHVLILAHPLPSTTCLDLLYGEILLSLTAAACFLNFMIRAFSRSKSTCSNNKDFTIYPESCHDWNLFTNSKMIWWCPLETCKYVYSKEWYFPTSAVKIVSNTDFVCLLLVYWSNLDWKVDLQKQDWAPLSATIRAEVYLLTVTKYFTVQ